MANLIENELSHVYELARQLEDQLRSAPIELQSTVQELIACLERTKSMVNSAVEGMDSPRSFMEETEQPFVAERKGMISRKRKSQPKISNQMMLGTGPEAEGPLDDGYSWRKYGQKGILGAKNPRAYYRCTHSNTRGCPARKQMQKSENNPQIFVVTYHGNHTCLQKSSLPNHEHKNDQPLLLSFQTNLKVQTENLDMKFQDPTSSFSFPQTPIDNYFESGFSGAFISPSTSGSNYFSASPRGMSGYGGPSVQASESDLAETVSSISTDFCADFLIEFDADFQPDLLPTSSYELA